MSTRQRRERSFLDEGPGGRVCAEQYPVNAIGAGRIHTERTLARYGKEGMGGGTIVDRQDAKGGSRLPFWVGEPVDIATSRCSRVERIAHDYAPPFRPMAADRRTKRALKGVRMRNGPALSSSQLSAAPNIQAQMSGSVSSPIVSGSPRRCPTSTVSLRQTVHLCFDVRVAQRIAALPMASSTLPSMIRPSFIRSRILAWCRARSRTGRVLYAVAALRLPLGHPRIRVLASPAAPSISATAAAWLMLNLPSRPVAGVRCPVTSITAGFTSSSTSRYPRP